MYSLRLEEDAFTLANVLRFLEESAIADGRLQDAAQFKNRREQLWAAADPELLKRRLANR